MTLHRSTTGFTLIELLLSVSIIGLLVGLSAPVYESFVRHNDLDLTTQSLAETLRRASAYARAGKNDDAWSVRIETTTATLFKGTVFGAADPNFTETLSIPGSITRSGSTEVQFAKFTGTPNVTGTNVITLTSSVGESRGISINAKAIIDY